MRKQWRRTALSWSWCDLYTMQPSACWVIYNPLLIRNEISVFQLELSRALAVNINVPSYDLHGNVTGYLCVPSHRRRGDIKYFINRRAMNVKLRWFWSFVIFCTYWRELHYCVAPEVPLLMRNVITTNISIKDVLWCTNIKREPRTSYNVYI